MVLTATVLWFSLHGTVVLTAQNCSFYCTQILALYCISKGFIIIIVKVSLHIVWFFYLVGENVVKILTLLLYLYYIPCQDLYVPLLFYIYVLFLGMQTS